MPTLTEKDLLGSLYDTFAERFAIRITNAKASIKAHISSEREQELLQIKSNVPCLIIKMVDRDQNDNPVMTAECIYRSDLYELQIQVSANMSELSSIDTKRVS
jgi:GntR family transcriptional regulator